MRESARELFPELAIYFKPQLAKEKRNEHVNDANKEFEHT
jgi:hypothetical protein